MKKTIYILSFITVVSFNAKTQSYTADGAKYFAEHLTSHGMTELISQSLPTLEDCKLIFKGDNADLYYRAIKNKKNEIAAKTVDESFEDLRINVFSTQDIEKGAGNYAGGMQNIVDKLQPYATFYRVTMLREKGANYGVSYKYWVNIKGRWVFFPKPWRFSFQSIELLCQEKDNTIKIALKIINEKEIEVRWEGISSKRCACPNYMNVVTSKIENDKFVAIESDFKVIVNKTSNSYFVQVIDAYGCCSPVNGKYIPCK